MSLLVDTNVLLRLTQKHHPHFAVAANAISTLQKRQANLHISHQNLVEFWAVATRPLGSNGLGLTIEQTVSEIEQLRSFIRRFRNFLFMRSGSVWFGFITYPGKALMMRAWLQR